ncbi:MAG TPA: DUF1573 domain-containing protein [Chitinophagales bacterium]|nr:DUF1573 domain-containing protein [Saprospiraceae bacterium]HNO29746.1 DUF1573 domain-containing protein [Chitinophagales bacterium]
MKLFPIFFIYFIRVLNAYAQPEIEISVDSSDAWRLSGPEDNPAFPKIIYYDYQIGEVPFGKSFKMNFYMKNISPDSIEIGQMYWGEGFISPEWVSNNRILQSGETGHFIYTYHSHAMPGNFYKAGRVSIKYQNVYYHINIIFRGNQLEKSNPQKEKDGDIPKIKWDDMDGYEFGGVQSGIPISHKFYFLNCGASPFEIKNVWFNGPRNWSKGEIQPGERGWIEINYIPHLEGNFRKQVGVYFIDFPEMTTVCFSGNTVLSQNSSIVQTNADFIEYAELPDIEWIDSTVFDFGEILVGPPVTHDFYFINHENHPIKILNVLGGSEPMTLDWYHQQILPEDTGWVRVNFSPTHAYVFTGKSVNVIFEDYNGWLRLSINGEIVDHSKVQIKWLDATLIGPHVSYDCGIISKQIFIHDFYFVNQGTEILSLNVRGGGGGSIWRTANSSVMPGDTSYIRCEYYPPGEGQFSRAGTVCLNDSVCSWKLVLKGIIVEEPTDSIAIKWLDSLYFDFGEILVGKMVYHDFRFVNTSLDVLSIDIRQTDGGTYWYSDKYTNILPGDTVTITAEHRRYITSNIQFTNQVRIYIGKNLPQMALYKLRIKGITVDEMKNED